MTAPVVAFLLRNIDTIRYDQAAADIHHRITELHRRASRAIDRSPSRVWAGPCHAVVTEVHTEERGGTVYTSTVTGPCQRDLYARLPVFDQDWLRDQAQKRRTVRVVCDGWSPDGRTRDHGCGMEHDIADREDWLVRSLENALVTLDELRDALPSMFPSLTVPPRGVLSSWVRVPDDPNRRAKLLPVGQNRLGQPTYRAREILALVRAYRPKTWAPRPNRRAS